MKLSTTQFAATLRELADAIEQGDSFEGNLDYTCFGQERGEWEVFGGYRIGNLQGQGGVRVLQATPAEPQPGDSPLSPSAGKIPEAQPALAVARKLHLLHHALSGIEWDALSAPLRAYFIDQARLLDYAAFSVHATTATEIDKMATGLASLAQRLALHDREVTVTPDPDKPERTHDMRQSAAYLLSGFRSLLARFDGIGFVWRDLPERR